MTDPFKNQRYSYKANLAELRLGDQTGSSSSSNLASANYSSSLGRMPLNQPIESANLLDNSNRQEFYQNYILANRDNIKQLKSNIELLFKGAKIFGQFTLYPLRALRWQCQMNSESSKFHLTPVTLMPVFYNLNYHGFITLWKGCFSMAAYTGVKMIIESVLGEITSFEKNIDDATTKQGKIYGHVILKLISNILTTSMFSAVIYESVQSGISNENFGIVDLLKETWNRVTGYRYNYRTRLIPFWSLILPTTSYFVGIHLASNGLQKFLRKGILIIKQVFTDKRRIVEEVEQEVVENPYIEALIDLSSQIGAILALYPLETVLNRMIVQGTRTIIDNTDAGFGVVPINTRYDGFVDCVQMISQTEGVTGFYKGVGALAIEVTLQYFILKLAKSIALRIYDSEWTARSDMNNIKNLMTSSQSSN